VEDDRRRIEDLEAVVASLEDRVEQLSARLGQLEGSTPRESQGTIGAAQENPSPPPPPSRSQPPTPPPVFVGFELRPVVPPQQSHIPQIAPAAKPKVDSEVTSEHNEYIIGAKVLPRVGAAISIIGLAYLVSIGLQRHLISPTMVWWGVTVLVSAIWGLGHWLRGEREAFGEIVAGVGSSGLFLNFVAGYAFQHLYGVPTFAVLVLLHGLANIAYAEARVSPAFLLLGAFGGFIGADIPAYVIPTPACVGLLLLVSSASAVIAARKRWLYVLGAVAVAGSVAAWILALKVSGDHVVDPWLQAAILLVTLPPLIGMVLVGAETGRPRCSLKAISPLPSV
jgi:uncharacterized membrane protein